jgi:RNA polymerase sigma factor (sigma-70 family)
VETDAELVHRSRRDPRAFEILFQRHFDVIYGFLARRVGRELAGDLASDTFTTAFGARRRYDLSRSDARPWLFGIAANLLRRHHRDEDRRLRALARLDRARDGESEDEPRLAAALAALAPEERDVLFLYAWADLGYEQIAEALALTIGTVRSRLHRARMRVRQSFAEQEALDG